jgi:tRNA threonylcarbamoyladenosine biosynthesis protein TsaE
VALVPAEVVLVRTAEHMELLGRTLATLLTGGDVVVLDGDLGAGKTTLTKGIGCGLGVRGPVTSPTFVMARHHRPGTGALGLVHVDAYRLGHPVELDDLDLPREPTDVTVMEWGADYVDWLDESYLVISIDRGPADAEVEEPGAGGVRALRVSGHGSRWSPERTSTVREALKEVQPGEQS